MINSATFQKMEKMKLYGMARAFQANMESHQAGCSPEELIANLIDCEWEDRHARKIGRLVKSAKFRIPASIDQIDYGLKRSGLDKDLFLKLSGGYWLANNKNVVITGPTGIGKSFLSCAIGHGICTLGHSVLYFNTSKLFSILGLSKGDGTYMSKIDRIKKSDLLILDDFGIEPVNGQNRLSLLEIMEDRYGLKSTIISAQFPPNKWHEIIEDVTIADAFCDRIVHNAFKIKLNGESVRKIYGERLD